MSAQPEPLTANLLAEEEKRRTIEATCPLCGKPSQVVRFDRSGVDPVFDAPSIVPTPQLRAFVMACGCEVSARQWTLHVQADPRRAWSEAAR